MKQKSKAQRGNSLEEERTVVKGNGKQRKKYIAFLLCISLSVINCIVGVEQYVKAGENSDNYTIHYGTSGVKGDSIDKPFTVFLEGSINGWTWDDGASLKISRMGEYQLSATIGSVMMDADGAVYFLALGTDLSEFPQSFYIVAETLCINSTEYAFNQKYAGLYNVDNDYRVGIVNKWAGEKWEWANPLEGNPSIFLKEGDVVTVKFKVYFGTQTNFTGEEEGTSVSDTSYNVYLGYQTNTYAFRERWDNEDYGLESSELDYKSEVGIWGSVGDLLRTKVEIKDARIDHNGTYTVSISGMDLTYGGTKSYNVIFLSTDIPYSMQNVSFSNVSISIDGGAPVVYMNDLPLLPNGSEKYFIYLLVNDAGYQSVATEYKSADIGIARRSISVTFTVSGIDFINNNATETPMPMSTPTPTPIPTPTATPTPMIKPTATPTPTPASTVKPTATPVPTAKATATPTIKPTPMPTIKPTATPTPAATSVPQVTATPQTTVTPQPVITKKTPVISGQENITKTYSKKSFSLPVEVETDGGVYYKSSNTKVVSVSGAGKVSIKGYGKVYVTVTTGETAQYQKGSKQFTITIIPKKVQNFKLSTKTLSKEKKVLCQWSGDKTVKWCEIQLSEKKNFVNPRLYTPKMSKKRYQFGVGKKKRYYIRMRSYIVVSGESYYSKWTVAKRSK